MQTALNCSICRPPELDQLIASQPSLAAHWMALPRRSLAAKARLHSAGNTMDRTWLVERGLVRSFYLGEQGVERNRTFHAEGSWLGSGVPPVPSVCPYTIEALESSLVVELSYVTLEDWRQRFPAIRALMDEAMGCLFAGHAQREAELLTLAPAERYQAFLEGQHALVHRIPIHHVASYLGVSSVSLSRIRARLGLANQGRTG
jgi:CRP-like cAMP-binding protein